MLIHGGLDYGSIRNHATREVSYVHGVKGPTIAGGYKFAALTSEKLSPTARKRNAEGMLDPIAADGVCHDFMC